MDVVLPRAAYSRRGAWHEGFQRQEGDRQQQARCDHHRSGPDLRHRRGRPVLGRAARTAAVVPSPSDTRLVRYEERLADGRKGVPGCTGALFLYNETIS